MLKVGSGILTTWLVLNLIPSLAIVFQTLSGRGHTPALYTLLSEAEIQSLSPETLATLDSIAVFANLTNVAFCLLSLCVIWRGLIRRRVWAFWGLLSGFAAALLAGVAADFVVGFALPEINAISGGILAAGFGLVAKDLFWNQAPARVV